MQANIFREYDIRGVVDKDLTDQDVVTLGKAMGTYHGPKRGEAHHPGPGLPLERGQALPRPIGGGAPFHRPRDLGRGHVPHPGALLFRVPLSRPRAG